MAYLLQRPEYSSYMFRNQLVFATKCWRKQNVVQTLFYALSTGLSSAMKDFDYLEIKSWFPSKYSVQQCRWNVDKKLRVLQLRGAVWLNWTTRRTRQLYTSYQKKLWLIRMLYLCRTDKSLTRDQLVKCLRGPIFLFYAQWRSVTIHSTNNSDRSR